MNTAFPVEGPAGNSGNFIVNHVVGVGNAPLVNPQLLGSDSFNFQISGTTPLVVWVTSQDNLPLGPSFLSTLTTNEVPAGWTVEEKTWIGPDNAMFGTGTLIADHVFGAIGTAEVTGFASPASPYSFTAEYIITPNGTLGSANSTIDVFSAPEPSSLLLLGTGLLGLGFRLRRKQIGSRTPIGY